MSDWPTKPLREVCEINPKPVASQLSNDSIVTFVPMTAVDEVSGTIKWPETRRFEEVKKGYTSFIENDVLFAKITPCMQNGKSAIVPNIIGKKGFGSTEFHVLRPGQSALPEWIFAFIRQPEFRRAAEASFTGTAGQQRVPVDFLRRALIPVPPLGEQKRLVAMLRAAAELRSMRSDADEHTRALNPAVFHEMFGDPALNPKKWPTFPAGALMEECDYGTSKKANDKELGIPVLRMGNVTEDGTLNLDDLKWVELDEVELAKQRLRSGDILFNRTNSRELVGKTGLWDGRFEAVPASYFIRVRFDRERVHPAFFWAFMNTAATKRRLFEIARGAIGQANINAKELRALVVPLPPLPRQIEFAERVAEIAALQAEQAISGRRLQVLHASVLHRAFAGQL